MEFTLSEVLAVVGAMVASAGVATGIVKWILDGSAAGLRRVDDRCDGLERALPKDYVPRQELNGRLSAINTTMQQGFAVQHEALAALKSSIDAVHARVDQFAQGAAPPKRPTKRSA